MPTGTNIEYARQYNLRVILDAVRLNGPITQAELARLTSLTPQTVHNIVNVLLDGHVVRRAGLRQGQRGKPAAEIVLNPTAGYSIGLQLDRDHFTAVLVDLTGVVHRRVLVDTSFPTPAVALDLMRAALDDFAADDDIRRSLYGLGIAMPGPFEVSTGRLVNPPNFPGWDDISVRDLLAPHTTLPLFVENDATAAAIGELWYGAGRHVPDFCYVFFGVGLGGGLVLGGEPYSGHNGNAGEIGHVTVVPGGRPCSCGERGCLEQYASLAALHAHLEACGVTDTSPDHLSTLHAAQHPALTSWLTDAAEKLHVALNAVAQLLVPQAVIFGGRLPEALLRDLIGRLERHARQHGRSLTHVDLAVGQFVQDAASLGAATLPIYQMLSPKPHTLLKKPRAGAPEPGPDGPESEVLMLAPPS